MALKALRRSHREGITLLQLSRMFPDDATAEAWFRERWWPNGPTCPHCGATSVQSDIKHPTMTHRCRECPKRPLFSMRTGTLMEGSKLGYRTWAFAVHLVTTNIEGVSSTKLHRDLGVSQKTAWHMAQRIREAWETNDPAASSGPVEVDEIYIDGREKNEHSEKKLRAADGNEAPESRIRARNKERILNAAVKLFADKGFHGTPMEEIAQASGLPKANVYYYFPTKRSIYAAIIERLIEGWDLAFEHIVPEREPRDAIAAYIRAKLEYSRRHAADSRLFANEILSGAQLLERRQRRHIRDVTTQRAHVVEEWIRRGQMAPVDPRHFFIMLWSATEFYADFGAMAADVLEKRRLTRKDFDAAAETITRVILDGCCGPPRSGQ